MHHSLSEIRKRMGIDIPTGLEPKEKARLKRIIQQSEGFGRKKLVSRPSPNCAENYKLVNRKSNKHKKPDNFVKRAKSTKPKNILEMFNIKVDFFKNK